ncbi:hypothetical protein KVT40_001307 [Elsinoe batatas]|uniref:Transcription factor domain-containing protein n=1 Tax=Elsinoe batatas TaxID=2601811 RepID=A0A8K0L7S7_9PEZI|nr:hypothetical protein KVT40_001307 [Elsinoe batatas]
MIFIVPDDIMLTIVKAIISKNAMRYLGPWSLGKKRVDPRLSSRISQIKHQLYRFIAPDELSLVGVDAQSRIQVQIDAWLEESTTALNSIPETSRRTLPPKLQIKYQFAIGLLYQPSQLYRNPSSDALRLCLESASRRIRLYWSLHTQQDLVLTWPNTHGIFLAGATLVYCIWSSAELRASADITGITVTIRLCSSLLILGAEWWPLARRGSRSFERLADATIRLLGDHGEIDVTVANQPANPLQTLPQSQPHSGHQSLSQFDGTQTFISDNTFGDQFLLDHGQWFDIESILQPFLQGDDALHDVLDNLDASPFDIFSGMDRNT